MGIVHHQKRIVSLTDASQFREWRNVSVHAEHAIGNHQFVAGGC